MATFQATQRKARYGHRDWLFWRRRDGVECYAQRSADAVKAALLDIGTQGWFTVLSASTGVPMKMRWRDGIRLIRNASVGC